MCLHHTCIYNHFSCYIYKNKYCLCELIESPNRVSMCLHWPWSGSWEICKPSQLKAYFSFLLSLVSLYIFLKCLMHRLPCIIFCSTYLMLEFVLTLAFVFYFVQFFSLLFYYNYCCVLLYLFRFVTFWLQKCIGFISFIDNNAKLSHLWDWSTRYFTVVSQ